MALLEMLAYVTNSVPLLTYAGTSKEAFADWSRCSCRAAERTEAMLEQ